MRPRLLCSTLIVTCLVALSSGQSNKTLSGSKTTGAAARQQPEYKGVFEPVNYGEDVDLNSVYFKDENEGWAAGSASSNAGGVIIHTTDGGKTWAAVAGDPESNDPPFKELRYSGGQYWVLQGYDKLLRSSDGNNWQVAGAFPHTHTDWAFLNENEGVAISAEEIHKTVDGGKNWKKVFDCVSRAQKPGGLAKKVQCRMQSLSFINDSTGFAVGQSHQEEGTFVGQTQNGGSNWEVWNVDLPKWAEEGYFLDENMGFMKIFLSDEIYHTSDGGRSWTALPGGKAGMQFEFAGPVGWTFNWNSSLGNSFTFTTDSGKRWTSRPIQFASQVNAFALPKSDRGYVVGDHGMVYRYSVVQNSQRLAPGSVVTAAMPRGGTAGGGDSTDSGANTSGGYDQGGNTAMSHSTTGSLSQKARGALPTGPQGLAQPTGAQPTGAQPTGDKIQTDSATPCCGIRNIDGDTGTVTALDARTGQLFRFQASPDIMGQLRIGQKVFANMQTGKVGLMNGEPCCAIAGAQPTGAQPVGVKLQPDGVEPCCAIRNINGETGMVTAVDARTGKAFRFQASAEILGTLQIGQKVFANMQTGKVGITNVEPCCAIVH